LSPVPAQLPAAPPDFTGREAELGLLNALLDRPAGKGRATTITTIAGTAGVGKSALAVHWAHQVRERYPDGQLYVNLRGFEHADTARNSAMKPAEAVRSFLDAFGVPRHRIPVGLESQAALYRSLVADRRVLILLDNARDTDQVRPLLPGGSACLAVIISRNELPGLIAVDGAQPVSLDLLSVPESRELLTRRLGAARVATDPGSIDEIIASCARLPLALTIAAARAAARPRFPLSVLADELRGIRSRLDAFDGGDRATDIRAVFSWSYQALSPASARLFRLLGLHPGPDATAPAAASLSGSPVGGVRRCLIELARANLVTERSPGRFEFHDLLRSYAHELADQLDPPELCRAATGRLLDHYLQTAARAHQLLNPYHDDPIALPPVTDGVEVGEIADHDHALSWFAAERAVLLAALRRAGDAGLGQQAWQLAWAITPFLEYQGYWHEWRAALEACRQHGDLHCRALTTRLLGRALVRLGRFDDAHEQLNRALSLYQEIDDAVGRAHTHRDIAWKLDGQGGHAREALDHVERAYELFRQSGHRSGEGRTLNGIGWFQITLGDYEVARIRCMEALALQREIGDRFGQAETWDSLGFLHLHLGQYAPAISCYERALELYGEFHDQYNIADSMNSLGDVHRAAGNSDAARKAWMAALPILDRLGHPDADRLRGKLRSLEEIEIAETALATAR
jgi:tetratricopeptide (TPR) repeat protein